MAPQTIAFLLIVAAIGLVVGGMLGWLLGSLRGDKKAEPPERLIVPKVEAFPDHKLYLRVWKHVINGGLVFDLRGKRLSDANTLSQEERDEMLRWLEDTADWLGLPDEQEAQPVRKEPDPRSFMVEQIETVSDVPQTSFMGEVTGAIADAINPVPKTARKQEPKSIVQQIDAIFQDKLAQSEFAGQKIYIAEDTVKGVIVWIGNAMYEGVGAVPEGEIKKILRSSVMEWEKIQEKGRRGAVTG